MGETIPGASLPPIPSGAGTLVLITRDGMGHAAPELRQKLLKTYLTLLDQNQMLPGAIAFYTDGVRLVVEGSPVLDVLKSLESKGVRLIVCTTCLNAFGLADKVKVGVVGGMTDIVSAQWKAQKVITI
jgi:intracellular sulfur oxidation DsrE/DsrF family protein